jgi:hypothetical protein
MDFFKDGALRKNIVFVSVLMIGAVIWWYGSTHLVKHQPEADEEAYQVEDVQILPVPAK